MSTLRWALAISLVNTLFAGCGPGSGSLKGTVSVDGKLLDNGSVMAVGSNGQPLVSKILANGTYSFEVLPVEKFRFAVMDAIPVIKISAPTSPQMQRFKKDRPGAEQIAKDTMSSQPTSSAKPPKQLVPGEYRDLLTSPLYFELKPGLNQFDIEIDSKP